VELPFIKKLSIPGFSSLGFFSHKPTDVVGIDIGTYSTKVVELRYERERAVLQTYGELLNSGYVKEKVPGQIVISQDADTVALLKDLFREANVKSKDVIFSVPASSSFVTTIQFPKVPDKEIESAIPFEARKYVPIPIGEVVLDWIIIPDEEKKDIVNVLLIAVPRDVIERYKRIAGVLAIQLRALEIESFSVVRSFGADETGTTAFINFGHRTTSLAIARKGRLYGSYSIGRGSLELTSALERGLGVNTQRAEAMKHEIGISEKIEERDITSVMLPFLELLMSELQRSIGLFNRKTGTSVQRIVLTGGGANLKGLTEHVATRFGLEVALGNPFDQVVAPPIMQPILRSLGPSFSVAIGLALHQIT